MSKSEAVVIESIEVREPLRFLFYLEILSKLSLLQRKHSKYMYAKCLNFPCFKTYLAACMHAFCMFYLYVSLGCSVRFTLTFKSDFCRSNSEHDSHSNNKVGEKFRNIMVFAILFCRKDAPESLKPPLIPSDVKIIENISIKWII